jgi:hypothetical protein
MSSSSPSLPQALVDEFKKLMIEEAAAARDLPKHLINAGLLESALFTVLSSLWSGGE